MSGGTLLSSTRYIHYGTIDFVMREPGLSWVQQCMTEVQLTVAESSKWVGVITAAITMSDVKDEIDFVGQMTMKYL